MMLEEKGMGFLRLSRWRKKLTLISPPLTRSSWQRR